MQELMPSKVKAINNALSKSNRFYAESNHNFIKGFGWLLPEYIPQEEIGVVILRRDPERIAKSMYRMGANAFNNDGRGALIHVNAKQKLVPPPKDIPFLVTRYYYYRMLHRVYYFAKARPRLTLGWSKNRGEPHTPYELNIKLLSWYAREVYALAEKYVKTFPRITYYEARTEDLNQLSTVREMFGCFGLQPKDTLADVVGIPVNVQPQSVQDPTT
jgi:hypothetical protein